MPDPPLQHMSPSQVSGGFWCQLPSELATKAVKCQVMRKMRMVWEEHGEEVVVWLPRAGNTAGLSGKPRRGMGGAWRPYSSGAR